MSKFVSITDYLNSLIDKEETVLDLGCGDKILDSFLNGKITTVDIWKKFKPDIQWNLNNIPLPFKDNSYDNILLIDVIEHLKKINGYQLLKEAKRITKNKIFIFTPLFWDDNHKNIENPNSRYFKNFYNKHLSLWTEENFKDWTELTNIIFTNKMYFGMWRKV